MEKFTPEPYCEETIEYCEQFGKHFDYKPEDIDDLEEILEIIHDGYENKKIPDEIAERVAVSMGIYLGQVMLLQKLSECGYEWKSDTSEPYLANDDENKMFPITKVWKRITNGFGDNIKIFYQLGISIAEKGSQIN